MSFKARARRASKLKSVISNSDPSQKPREVRLADFSVGDYHPGKPFWFRALWFFVNGAILQCKFNPFGSLQGRLLKLFGAKIGQGVVFKPNLNVKNPWLLEIGDDCWIGEGVWIDNLVLVKIGANVCLSQDAYLCTGNHDWSDPAMGYKLGEIQVEDGAWIGARATVLPGLRVGKNAIVTAGAVLARNAEPDMIYVGNPAIATKRRKLES